jgi:hypothetical protein
VGSVSTTLRRRCILWERGLLSSDAGSSRRRYAVELVPDWDLDSHFENPFESTAQAWIWHE